MMHNKGLTKLIEECGELVQIAAKKAAYMDTDEHPDGKGSLKERLENELSDVIAAIAFVDMKLKLDRVRIDARAEQKLVLFEQWDAG
jgi:NTP pyrophosphatase (non-canonical NTP hydrolase)